MCLFIYFLNFELGDAKTNSFIDPTALAFDYQSNKLYVMDREAVRFIDMMTLKAYTLHSDKSSDIKMGISPNTQPGLMVSNIFIVTTTVTTTVTTIVTTTVTTAVTTTAMTTVIANFSLLAKRNVGYDQGSYHTPHLVA